MPDTETRKLLKIAIMLSLVIGVILHVWHVLKHWEIMMHLSTDVTRVANIRRTDVVKTQYTVLDDLYRPEWQSGEPNGKGSSLLSRNFALLIDQTRMCRLPRNGKIDLFIIITSRGKERSLRNTIRQTWLTLTRNNTSNVRYMFMIGRTSSNTVPGELRKEAETYQDIVVYDFKDTYENLTLKTVYGLKYAASYCSNARYVMKTDSDVYVNIPPLVDFLSSENASNLHAFGLARFNKTPVRDSFGAFGKWHVSLQEFPESRYPAYLDGMGYILHMKVVHALSKIFPLVRFLRLEDVYIGMCLERLGLRPQGNRNILRIGRYTPCSYRALNVFAMHGVSEQMLRQIWKQNCTGVQNSTTLSPLVVRSQW